MPEHQLTRTNKIRDMLHNMLPLLVAIPTTALLVGVLTDVLPQTLRTLLIAVLLLCLIAVQALTYPQRMASSVCLQTFRSLSPSGECPRDVAARVSPSKVAVTHPRNRRAPQVAGRECPLARQGMVWRRGLRTEAWVARAPPGRVVVVRSMDGGCGVVMGGEERGGL